ncbi:MAG: AAA family ATPase [Chromatiales bacterium]|nr:AAA family ATPase [Chromatiales bacterium]
MIRRFGEFDLDAANARLLRAGKPLHVPPKSFDVLSLLVANAGTLVNKEHLLDQVWGHRFVSDSVLKNAINTLRDVLGDDARAPRFIETAPRRGYRFIAPLTGAAATAARPVPGTPPATPAGTACLGRERPLAQLDACWRNACSGQRQIVLIAGEAGVGKSTLIEHFVAGLEREMVVFGQCVEQYGAGEAYLPILEAVPAACALDDALPALMREVAPTWLLQLPWLVDDGERELLMRRTAGASQDRMLRELGALLDRYTARRPLLIVLEDLHWSDHATIALLDYLARRKSHARFMLVGTFRPAEIADSRHPLASVRRELRLHRLCDELVLSGFTETDLRDYLDRRFDRMTVEPAFVQALYRHTEGLPLFVANVLDDLVDNGVIVDEKGRWRWAGSDSALAALRVPEDLAGVIEKQILRLPKDVQTLLQAAGVEGTEFHHWIVAAALDLDPDTVQMECERLARAQTWLHHAGMRTLANGAVTARYAFRHALYRHVFYKRIAPTRRIELHRRVGLALREAWAGQTTDIATELTHHFQLGQDWAAAVRHGLEAAGRSLRLSAPVEAEDMATHMLALLPRVRDPDMGETELALTAIRGIALSQTQGVGADATGEAFRHAWDLWRKLPDSPTRRAALNGLLWFHYVRGEFRQVQQISEMAWPLATRHGDTTLELSICNVMCVTEMYLADYAEAGRWAQRGHAIAGGHDAPWPAESFVIDPVVSITANHSLALLYVGELDRARNDARLALERASALASPMALLVAHWLNAILAQRLDLPDDAHLHADALMDLADRYALAQAEGPARWLSGWAEARLGDPEGGYRRIVEGHQFHLRVGMHAGGTHVHNLAAEARLFAGDPEGTLMQLDQADALADRIEENLERPFLLTLRGRALAALGDTAQATETLERAIELAQAQNAHLAWLQALLALYRLPGCDDDINRERLKHALARIAGDDVPCIVEARSLLHAGRQ